MVERETFREERFIASIWAKIVKIAGTLCEKRAKQSRWKSENKTESKGQLCIWIRLRYGFWSLVGACEPKQAIDVVRTSSAIEQFFLTFRELKLNSRSCIFREKEKHGREFLAHFRAARVDIRPSLYTRRHYRSKIDG